MDIEQRDGTGSSLADGYVRNERDECFFCLASGSICKFGNRLFHMCKSCQKKLHRVLDRSILFSNDAMTNIMNSILSGEINQKDFLKNEDGEGETANEKFNKELFEKLQNTILGGEAS